MYLKAMNVVFEFDETNETPFLWSEKNRRNNFCGCKSTYSISNFTGITNHSFVLQTSCTKRYTNVSVWTYEMLVERKSPLQRETTNGSKRQPIYGDAHSLNNTTHKLCDNKFYAVFNWHAKNYCYI